MNNSKPPKSLAAIIVGRNVKRLRNKANISQAKLAERIGSSTNNVYQIEVGARYPSGEMIDKLVKAFRCEYFELFIDFEKLDEAMAKNKIVSELEVQAHSTIAKFLEETLK